MAIYEMRTYDLKPRSLPEVEKRFGEAYEYRKKYSPLAAFWHTEVGPLNIKNTKMVEEGLSVQVTLEPAEAVALGAAQHGIRQQAAGDALDADEAVGAALEREDALAHEVREDDAVGDRRVFQR